MVWHKKMGGYKKRVLKMSIYPPEFSKFSLKQKYSRWHRKGWHKNFKNRGWHKKGWHKNFRGGIKLGGIKI